MTVPTFIFIYERLASVIGNGGLADIGQAIVGSDVLSDKRRERECIKPMV